MSTFAVHLSYPSSPPGMKLVGKRYVSANAQQEGLPLVFTHYTGAHKELREPAIQKLFDLHSKRPTPAIRKAWAFAGNHGEAGVVNAGSLKSETNGLLHSLLSTLPPSSVSYRAIMFVEPSLITREMRLKHKAERRIAPRSCAR
ncbi:hypothetical protein OBBRIDRAFT_839014 [Obba rivulosa]|uniref:Uncharacterized protein n=1 Tax=Obba rivulosa TaxID=1052685 RepID=A0A8E2AL51_9APHY|nr:hypothetical protein OBBRIDRAFT_839014 [Obba rivulosa]